MTHEQTVVLVLVDAAANYYLLEQEALARARVPDERKPALDRLLAGDDTTGMQFAGGSGEDTGGRLAVLGLLRLPAKGDDGSGYKLEFPNLVPAAGADVYPNQLGMVAQTAPIAERGPGHG